MRNLLTLRRIAAAVLVLLSTALLLRPRAEDSVPMLVAARALTAGADLSAADVRVVRAPPELRPESAFTDPASAAGRILALAAAEGEPITEARLVGPAAIDASQAVVAVRLTDPDLVGAIRPGARVDVVSAAQEGSGGSVLAHDATVVTVRANGRVYGRERGTSVLIALPRDSATRVASISLERPVTVTLR
ncbi:Heat shock protein 22.5 (Hsp22.5) [Alloactinosynnema sp. L-07]|uniref:SAF domain-containing protein n=1 Tax=Alloactinosynnema sp. L-07 TaxID=1653480 RepID=UPI00065F02D4|nr:SAF domain-containing protein [Alloactinosynnema sp. L-07]CRK61436.1 Heat shock protein 22.5 (Hsp22.5) [Alloactinosynnema sp. L-07]